MTLRYLLDTNIVSALARPNPPAHLRRACEDHDGEIALATIVWHELRFGCELLAPSRRRDALTRFLDAVVRPSFPLLAYDERAASWHATERTRLVRAGRTPAFVDGQIAAIAMVNGLTLVTDNVSDFEHFAEVRWENWLHAT